MNIIYTIGHSHHSLEEFFGLVSKYDINVLFDVRSTPYSRHAAQFNREFLQERLDNTSVKYFFMGKFFGARPDDKSLYSPSGVLDFEKVAKSEKFIKGVNSTLIGIEQGNRICLMCSEKEPIECHRTILVARAFYELGIMVRHILADGTFLEQADIEKKLLDIYFPDRQQYSMFDEKKLSNEDYLNLAYKKRNADIGYNIN